MWRLWTATTALRFVRHRPPIFCTFHGHAHNWHRKPTYRKRSILLRWSHRRQRHNKWRNRWQKWWTILCRIEDQVCLPSSALLIWLYLMIFLEFLRTNLHARVHQSTSQCWHQSRTGGRVWFAYASATALFWCVWRQIGVGQFGWWCVTSAHATLCAGRTVRSTGSGTRARSRSDGSQSNGSTEKVKSAQTVRQELREQLEQLEFVGGQRQTSQSHSIHRLSDQSVARVLREQLVSEGQRSGVFEQIVAVVATRHCCLVPGEHPLFFLTRNLFTFFDSSIWRQFGAYRSVCVCVCMSLFIQKKKPICLSLSCKRQNARQKQRKIYENQPNNALYESEEKKASAINYTCKKCQLVFQRYYELIRHQKNHCFKVFLFVLFNKYLLLVDTWSIELSKRKKKPKPNKQTNT